MFFKQIQQHGDNFSYLIADDSTKEAAVVDSSFNATEIIREIKAQGFTLKYIINTHGHSEHTAGNLELHAAFAAKIVAYTNSRTRFDIPVEDGETLQVGSIPIKVIYTPGPCGHFWLYGDNGDDISDDFVRTHATDDGFTTSKQKFNFIWACANGDLCCYDAYGNYYNVAGIFSPLENPCTPPPTNNNTKYGFWFGTPPYPLDTYGMPFAWTGRLDMNLDGYNSNSGDYCYIGFEGASPFMGNSLPETSVTAVNFPCRFYLRFLGWDMPYYLPQQVDYSLDYASDSIYECNFYESDLYTGYWVHTDVNEGDPVTGWWFCHMRVFGNGDLTLAY